MNIAVIIPIYRTKLHWFEQIALEQAKRLLCNFPIFILIPKGLDVSAFMGKNVFTASFSPKFFKDIDGYNALMLDNAFYKRFSKYDYILIFQLDAFVFSDQLERFCQMGYDYIGAPWSFCGHVIIDEKAENPPIDILHVGNGGFSLRKPKACSSLLKKYARQLKTWSKNEDTFFAYFGKKKETKRHHQNVWVKP